AVQVFMQADWVFVFTGVCVPRRKAASIRIHLPGAEKVEAQVCVEPFAAVQMRRLRRGVGRNQQTEGVVRERVHHDATSIEQQAGAPMSIRNEVIRAYPRLRLVY